MRLLVPLVAVALAGCSASGTRVRAWVAADVNGQAVGRDPLAFVLVTEPLGPYLEAQFLHGSSLVQRNDPGAVDAVGLGVCVRLPVQPCAR